LLLAEEQAKPGSTVLAGIELRMEPEWHTYWKNSGDSGSATEVKWQLPSGVKAAPLQWPLPRKLTESTNLMTYVYDDRVVLLVPLTLSQDLPPGPLPLKAGLTWLECKTSCIPGEQDIKATLTIGSESKPSKDAELLRAWQEKMPKPGDKLSASASWESGGNENSRKVLIEWSSATKEADFFPETSDAYEVQSPTERLVAGPGTVRLRKEVKKLAGDWPRSLPGVLAEGSGKDQVGYQISLPLSGSTGSTTSSTRAAVSSPAPSSCPVPLEARHLQQGPLPVRQHLPRSRFLCR
jgi:thiol:disulfide interchange protein DsbD